MHALTTSLHGKLRQLRKTMRDDKRMLRTLIGNLQGMVYRCRNDAEWTMELVSDGCRELTGYEPADLLLNSRISYERVTHPDDRVAVRRQIAKALTAEERFSVEYRINCRDGTTKWVWETGVGIGRSHEPEYIEGFIQDISVRKAAETKLELAERRYRDIFENAVEGIFQTTADGRYIDVNPALARIYGYDTPEALMSSLSSIGSQLYVEPGRREEFIARVRELGSVKGFVSQVYQRDGRIIWISENARCAYDHSGAFSHFEGTVIDITDVRAYEEQLKHQASHDPLTGLSNRAMFYDRLEHAIAQAQRHDSLMGVVFVDLDNFKQINDSFGHEQGDLLLKDVAARMSHCVRASDTVARYGGDEFALVLTGESDESAFAAVLERIRLTLSEGRQGTGGTVPVTCSIGAAVFPRDGADGRTLVKNADLAMYQAKAAGRNAIRLFAPELV